MTFLLLFTTINLSINIHQEPQDHQQSVPRAVVVAQNKTNLTENKLSHIGKNLKPRKREDRDLSIEKRQ